MKKDTKINFEPSFDRVLVRPQKDEAQKLPSGIYIPDTARKEKPEFGTIVAVGEGKRAESGEIIPMKFKVGQKVMFSKYGFDEITIDEEEFYVISESNILGVIK